MREGHLFHQYEMKSLPFFPFEISVELTSKGLHAAPGLGMAVVQCIFDYIAMLQAQGPQHWLWLENKVINDRKFRCFPPTSSCRLFTKPVRKVLNGAKERNLEISAKFYLSFSDGRQKMPTGWSMWQGYPEICFCTDLNTP